MSPAKSLLKTSYSNLLSKVKTELTSGLIEAQKIIEYQRVKTYWTIGQIIVDSGNLSHGKENPKGYNRRLYERIGRDVEQSLGLELRADTLQRCVRFKQTFPKFPKDTPLTFTHYLTLMRVNDLQLRLKLEKESMVKGLSSAHLKERVAQIKALPVFPATANTQRLLLERGEPYIYFLREAAGLKGEEARYIDCGFKIEIPVGGAIGLQARQNISGKGSRYVRSVKTARGYEAKLAVRKRACVYTYPARVLKVVDGDTIDVRIDVGFGIRVRERIRLRGIDAPETTSHAGQAAKRFLERYLSRCPMIVVRTQKAGMYGRWLGDLFALEGADDPFRIAAEGDYVNQIMIEKGLAQIYTG